MTTAFAMKASVSIFVLGLGMLVLWANNVHDRDSDAAKTMRSGDEK